MYTQELVGHERVTAGALLDLTAAAVDGEGKLFLSKIKINRIAVVVSTAVVSTGVVEVAFKKYVTPGSAVGAVLVGVVKIPAGTAAGKVVYKDVSPVAFNAGDSLITEVTVASAGGGAAGEGYPVFEGEYVGEQPANQPDMIASA